MYSETSCNHCNEIYKKDNQRLQFEEGHIIHWQKRTKLSLLSFNTNLQDEKSLNAMF